MNIRYETSNIFSFDQSRQSDFIITATSPII